MIYDALIICQTIISAKCWLQYMIHVHRVMLCIVISHRLSIVLHRLIKLKTEQQANTLTCCRLARFLRMQVHTPCLSPAGRSEARSERAFIPFPCA